MRKFLRAISSTILWSYDRGSWPYDVMVAAIVLFVLITPRRWFHDQPPNTSMSSAGVVLEADDPVTHVETFRLDRSLLGDPPFRGEPTAELEQKTHQILSDSASDLKSRSFKIESIQPVRGNDGSLLYYKVVVKR
ncbi:MAG TPA: hypothetical protein VKS20_13935 [Candidatus Acidoferrales bacterium]|nr:hypothetical protein [Candidatus Acidoferrales bacterium]